MSIDITTLALAKEYTNRMVGSGGTGGGVDGKDGITPHIGDNGNWFIGTVDTGISAQGPAGENGVTPHIGTNGNWYIGSVNTGVSAKGAKGDNGLDGNGIKSAILNSDYTLTLTFDDGTTYTTPSIRGATGSSGKDGPAGADGAKGEKGDRGEQGLQGIPGEKGDKGDTGAPGADGAKGDKGDKGDTGAQGNPGKDGANGKDGVSATHSWNGTTLTITSASGTSSADLKGAKGDKGDTGATGPQGPQGNPYDLTPADKAEIVAMVIESLGGNPIFGIVDEDNSIIVSGDLPDGTYSVKYEMANGSTVNIGSLVLDTNVYYSVTNTLTNCVNSNSATKVVEGESYSATITANSGHELKTVSVTMGGSPVTVSGGTISIANVTGNIVITAVAEEIKASYTNLADPASADWKEGYRLDGSGAPKQDSSISKLATTNFIACKAGDVVRIKGLTLGGTGQRVAVYTSNKENYSAGVPSFPHDDTVYNAVVETTGVYKCTLKYTNTAFIRFSGVLTGTSADVVITKNETI